VRLTIADLRALRAAVADPDQKAPWPAGVFDAPGPEVSLSIDVVLPLLDELLAARESEAR